MKRIKCYVIDDERAAINVLEHYIHKTAVLQYVGSTTDPKKGLRTLIRSRDIELVFLDVEMEPISGLELMQQLDPKIRVVLCTAHREFAVDAFDLQAADYLAKPFQYSRFLQAVHRVEAELTEQLAAVSEGTDYHYFFVKIGSKTKRKRVEFADLRYIIADKQASILHMLDSETIQVNMRLGNVLQYLPRNLFLRIHQGHAVNMNEVDGCDNGFVILKGDNKRLSLGDVYARDFYAWVDDYMLFDYPKT